MTVIDADVVAALEHNSRTFFLPIMRLDGTLRETVACYYLANRALDEIEDHPRLPPAAKTALLRGASRLLQQGCPAPDDMDRLLRPHRELLPPVTLRLHDWAVRLPPPDVAPRLWDALAAMADRMADWVGAGFRVESERDLDRYTFAVAGALGITLSDLWNRHAGVVTSQTAAVSFGRTAQAVNITWNRAADLARGVDFFPAGWTAADMCAYSRRQLRGADAYCASLPDGPIKDFCAMTRDFCRATLTALTGGAPLDREAITSIAARYP